jgi:UDP-glucose 4-epimerase
MRIVVTGGAGFIGSHLVAALVELNHTVEVIDDLSSGFKHNIMPGVKLHVLNICSSEAAEIIAGGNFDIVFHLAAQIDVRKSVIDPQLDLSVNVGGSINVLEACVRGKVKKIIFASSGGTGYGEQVTFPAAETHTLAPVCPYGITKITVERYLHYYQVMKGLEYVALRYANVYGPRQNPHGEAGVISIFAEKMLTHKPVFINGDGLQTRDFVHVFDVTRANLAAINYPKSDIFNVGTGIETTILSLFRMINQYYGLKVSEMHAPPKIGEQRRSVLSYEKMKYEMNWTPTIDLDTGLKQTLDWYAEKYK